MGEMDFSGYAPASCRPSEILSQKLRKRQNIFAKEAFNFLLKHAHLWIEYPKEFLFHHNIRGTYKLFTTNIGKEVTALAFLNRENWRKTMIENRDEFKYLQNYERMIVDFPVARDDYYYYNYLLWLSFIYSLSMFCYTEGYDYFKVGERCLARYKDVEFFYIGRGWEKLEETAKSLHLWETFSLVNQKRHASDDIILRFLKARRKFDRRYRYESNKWMSVTNGVLNIDYMNTKLPAKFRIVSAVDPRRVVPCYKILIKKESQNKLKECNGHCLQEDEQIATAEMLRKIQIGSKRTPESVFSLDLSKISDDKHKESGVQIVNKTECFPNGNISGSMDKSNTAFGNAKCDPIIISRDNEHPNNLLDELDKKFVFVINSKLLTKRSTVDSHGDDEYERAIKICSPLTNADTLMKNLQKVLDENISNKNYHTIAPETLAVCPPGCNFDDNDTTMMVLDTSTEDEDEDESYDLSPQSVCNAISEDCRSKGIKPILSPASSFGTMSRFHVDRAYLSSEHCEHQYPPTRNTGAIPKTRMNNGV